MRYYSKAFLVSVLLSSATVPAKISEAVKFFYNLEHKEEIVSGRIVDQSGNPVQGATVRNLRTSEEAVTDGNGNFSLDLQIGDELEINHANFGKTNFTVNSLSEIQVELTSNSGRQETRIEEVVVVGYGKQKKVNLTGAVDQITSESLQNRPVTVSYTHLTLPTNREV